MTSCFCFPLFPQLSHGPAAQKVQRGVPSAEQEEVAATLLTRPLPAEKLVRASNLKACKVPAVVDCICEGAEALSIFEKARYVTVGSVSSDGSCPWASPAAFWLTPVGSSIGICFATPPTSQKALNLAHGGRTACSLSIFESNAPLTRSHGLQATGTATALTREEWPRALLGLHARFPNFEGDVAQEHEHMFSAMEYILIEVVVDQWFRNSGVPVTLNYECAHLVPFSMGSALEPPPSIEHGIQGADVRDSNEELSQIASSIVGQAHQLTVASVSHDGLAPWTSFVKFWLVPVGCSIGICFAVSAESPEAVNLIHEGGRRPCSLSILDSDAPFLTGRGVQASATAAVVPRERWSQALQGLRTRLPNFQGDVVQLHEDLFISSGHILIEVVVEQWFMNLFTPTKFDHRVDVTLDFESVYISPFSTGELLE